MTKKTRIRVARIAAGAVIAAGASLSAAGAASALDLNIGVTVADEPDPGCDIAVDPECEGEGGENPGGENPGGENPGGENPGGENPGGETPGGENPGGEDPVEEPTENPTTPGDDNDSGTKPDGGNGASPQDEGSSALTDTGDDAPATSAQGNGKELAETGATETTFLLIGAATMIAGGIGFRVLPRLANGRGGAAA